MMRNYKERNQLVNGREGSSFCEQKEAKKLYQFDFLVPSFHGPGIPILLNESFCFFFQKEDFLLHLD